MTSIHEALCSVSLEQYSAPLQSAGYQTLESIVALNTTDLETLCSQFKMLKGHTFKLKKIVQDAKAGIMPKPSPVEERSKLSSSQSIQSNSIDSSLISVPNDILDKCKIIKPQLDSIISTRDSMLESFNALIDLNLNEYFQVLNQLEGIQKSIKDSDESII